MTPILHPTYFSSIAHYVAMLKTDTFTFEVCDNYQKQTYRNRMHIYGANGLLSLSIPVVFSQKNRQLYKDIKVSNTTNWQDLHWKSILSAYSSSPFFEYYEHELQPLFENKVHFLMDFNFKCFETILECMQLNLSYNKTQKFNLQPEQHTDYRTLVNNRKEIIQNFSPYTQVFDDKHGFLPNLSILDLLFNEGPNAELYLEAQQISL